jgi:hypothetical protein
MNIGLKESSCFRNVYKSVMQWECPPCVELCVNGWGRGHMLWDLFCGCVGAKLLRVFDVCEELSYSQWIAHSRRSELRRVVQASMDTWVRQKQLLNCVFSDPLFLVTCASTWFEIIWTYGVDAIDYWTIFSMKFK